MNYDNIEKLEIYKKIAQRKASYIPTPITPKNTSNISKSIYTTNDKPQNDNSNLNDIELGSNPYLP